MREDRPRCQRRYARTVVRHRTTLRELAEYTGLSPAAVSYALRGKQVSAETERRVREAGGEPGCEADPIARALAGGATAVVGLLVGSLSDFWNQELVRAVQRELYGAARSTLVADAHGEPARELELAERLVAQRVDGLVVVPIGPASGGWAAIARQGAAGTIGDALPRGSPPRAGGRGSRSATPCGGCRPPARWSSTTTWASSRACSTSASSGTGASPCSRGRSGPLRSARRSAPWPGAPRHSGSTAASSPAPTRSTAHGRSRSSC